MLIWRGLGFLVPVVIFGASLAANLLANSLGGPGYWAAHGWPFAVSMLASAVILGVLGLLFDKSPEHAGADFFFVPVKWWAPILIIVAVALLAIGWSPG